MNRRRELTKVKGQGSILITSPSCYNNFPWIANWAARTVTVSRQGNGNNIISANVVWCANHWNIVCKRKAIVVRVVGVCCSLENKSTGVSVSASTAKLNLSCRNEAIQTMGCGECEVTSNSWTSANKSAYKSMNYQIIEKEFQVYPPRDKSRRASVWGKSAMFAGWPFTIEGDHPLYSLSDHGVFPSSRTILGSIGVEWTAATKTTSAITNFMLMPMSDWLFLC